MKSGRVVTFGEIMMRLATPGFQRFVQARAFDVTYAGGEANVAVALALLGLPADFVTCLPRNDLGNACLAYLRQYGVGVDKIVRTDGRLGLYFLETGAVQRGSKVMYDRAASAIACVKPGMISWRDVFADAAWFHWTGITPAISEGAAAALLEAVGVAKEMNLTVSCDLNYRKNLWTWGKSAGEVMRSLVKYCDLAIGNEEDAEKVFGIRSSGIDVLAGKVEAQKYDAVCQQMEKLFPNLKLIAITLRGSISASHNTWSGLLWGKGHLYSAPVYDITHIVDRVGSGDAFAGGLIYGLSSFGDDRQRCLDFAVAFSCLKHTIPGDFNIASLAEAEQLMAGDASGRVSR